MARMTIIGLGLIGGSLGLALKAAPLHDLEIIGVDHEGAARKNAEKRGAVDRTETNLRRSVQDSGLVVIATPLLTIPDILREIAPALGQGAAVTDVASTKTDVLRWAGEILTPNISFVGGHPMAGKTERGIMNAAADLFQGRPYAIVPHARAANNAVQSVVGMAEAIGAKKRFMTADEHDYYVAAVSHLPIAVSTALFTLLRDSDGWADFGKMAGPAYYDLTRLASGDPRMSTDIMITNRERIQYWIDRFILELERMRQVLDESEETIMEEFEEAEHNRARFQIGADLQNEPNLGPLPTATGLGSILMGERLFARARELTEDDEKKNK